MKAIGFRKSLPITEPDSFIEFETDISQPTGKDILVKINAIGINPVDYKIRQNSAKEMLGTPKIIGWDAAGIVEAIGSDVKLFKKGDSVYYAEYQLVDERIVGFKPNTLSDAQAAAMPLTTLTAWEMLFDRIRINEKDKDNSVLIIGGAGGVGSIAIQLAKQVAGLTVIATASRPETVNWCKEQGADVVVNHKNLVEEVRNSGFRYVDFILELVDVNQYWDAMCELIKPQGHIASITGSSTPVALNKLKNKSASFSWELMYTRSTFQTDDMIDQHHILNKASTLFDNGTLTSTLNNTLHGFTVVNLKEAHRLQESGKAIGKTVIEY